nr:hypothetical protein BaRGS_032459 [Batillaria attramentaria]
MFDFSIDVTVNRAKTILELMEEAAWQDTTFKYSMEYHASVPGYMVNAVRKDEVQGNDYVRNPFAFGDVNWDGNHSYWRIQIDGTSIPVV